jgi:DNA-directed RNA polymerase specialized sigma24 family protein
MRFVQFRDRRKREEEEVTQKEFVEALRSFAQRAWTDRDFLTWFVVSAFLLGARIGGRVREGEWY